MSSFEENMKVKSGSAGKSDPPETDLDYYSRPENYTGVTNLQAMQRIVVAKENELKSKDGDGKKKRRKKDGFDFFYRYKQMVPFEEDMAELMEDEMSDEEDKNIFESSLKTLDTSKPPVTPPSLPQTPLQMTESTVKTTPVSVAIDETCEDYDSLSSSPVKTNTLSPVGRDSIDQSPSYTRRSTGAQSSAIMKSKMYNATKEARAKAAKEKFRHYSRLVKIIRGWITSMSKQQPSTGVQTFTALAAEESSINLKQSGLHFDPSYFKAKKEINISSEVKTILSLPSEARNPEQIQTAMYGLQSSGLRSFSEYPLHMQEKLCSVAWYETVPPKRIIIRQGHYAENFYFILSGQAIVTILVKDPKTGETVNRTATIMRKGMSFGELALLHHSRRTATVTSQDTMQLLTIGRDDFFDIFMSGGDNGVPDHIKYISQLDFMKDWPIERLLEHPEHCLLHFFKRNVVIVKDSNFSDWLYVVKSGSCQVLKQLRGVTARLGIRAHEDIEETFNFPMPEPKVDTWMNKKHLQSIKADKKEITPETKPVPVFVQVEHLKPRDTFGLETIIFDDDIEQPGTTVSLVARGAECIMLSKDFFAKHATEPVKRYIRQCTCPYPDNHTFQDNLQIKADWELYKQTLIQDLTSSMEAI